MTYNAMTVLEQLITSELNKKEAEIDRINKKNVPTRVFIGFISVIVFFIAVSRTLYFIAIASFVALLYAFGGGKDKKIEIMNECVRFAIANPNTEITTVVNVILAKYM